MILNIYILTPINTNQLGLDAVTHFICENVKINKEYSKGTTAKPARLITRWENEHENLMLLQQSKT